MPRPAGEPIGLDLATTAKAVTRAFENQLQAAGGSQPAWLVLMTLKQSPSASQRQIADAIGIRGATLTHHLDGMEQAGLITRRRDPSNRRVHIVELTTSGERLFRQLRSAAVRFDKQLNAGLEPGDAAALAGVLERLRTAVGASDGADVPHPTSR